VRIGSTDAPAIAGLSRWANERDAFNRIVLGMEAKQTKDMLRGKTVEPEILAQANRFGIMLEDRDNTIRIRHPDCEFAHAQVDGLGIWRNQDIVIEAKSVGPWAKGWGEPETDQVPESYRAQCIWEMACADRDFGIILAGFGAENEHGEFIITGTYPYFIERDPDLESYLFAVCGEFYRENLLTGIPPDVKAIQRYVKKETVNAS